MSYTQGKLVDPGWRYSLQVLMADGSVQKLQESLVISLIHKFVRRDDTSKASFLVCAFCHAMSLLSPEETNKMKGRVTSVLRRIAISFVEEGPANHLSANDLGKTVSLLLSARRVSLLDNPDWIRCAENLVDVFILIKGAYRCRTGSVTKSFSHKMLNKAEFGALEIRDLTEIEKEVVAAVNYTRCDQIFQAKKSSADFIVPYQVAVQYLRPLASLIDLKDTYASKFADSDELRKVIYSAAHCARIISASGASFPDQTIPFVRSEPNFLFRVSAPFTMAYVNQIGAIDQHVKGVTNPAYEAVFRDSGCRVTNPSPHFQIGGLGYQALETIYVEVNRVRNAEKANKKKQEKKNKRTLAKQRGGKKKLKKSSRNVSPPIGSSIPIFQDIDTLLAVDLVSGDRICGFKNFTVTGKLIAPKDTFDKELGPEIFLKIGEDVSCTLMTIRTTEARRKLGLRYVDSVMVGVKMNFDWWHRLAQQCHAFDPTGTRSKQGKTYIDWMRNVTGTYCHVKDGEVAAALLQKKFDGKRLTYIPAGDPRLSDHVYGKSMIQNLLFSKWIGTADMGPYNLMIDAVGHVLQVDVGPAPPDQMKKYNSKGLLTSHKITAKHLSAARLYAASNQDEIRFFLEDLAKHASDVRCPAVTMPSAAQVFDLLK